MFDGTPPDINQPTDVSYVEGSTGNSITWTVGSSHPGTYNITLDGIVIVPNTAYINGTITIDSEIDGLTVGTHTVVISIYDQYGAKSTDSVLVEVLDGTPPDINHPADINFVEKTTGNTISWTVGDIHPGTYNISIDDTLVVISHVWQNGSISFNLDSYGVGIHNLFIYIGDSRGNIASDTVVFTVLDGTSPDISHPADVSYRNGSTGNTITWTVGDQSPSTYSVTVNNTVLVSDTIWSNGSITVNIDNLAAGNYVVTLTISDTQGNSASDKVNVVVLAQENTSTSSSSSSSQSSSSSTSSNTIQSTTKDQTTSEKSPGFTIIGTLVALSLVVILPIIKRQYHS